MNWIEAIREVRKAQENNQLVVFVGAGVSRNSGLPSWGKLVNSFANEIGYRHSDRCETCDKQDTSCPKKACGAQQDFSQDEYLRIPEYYYQKDNRPGKKGYYEVIARTFGADYRPNSIDNEIFNLLPHHIITTNYDSLLEDSINNNAKLYTVVSQDKDLLSKASNRYIVKMHGDLAFPESIVLKESDYIDYEQNHPLISTFVRSLLINHSFLFLGYSLNDYNLNLIIGWINYFQKKYEVTERPKSFLITSSPSSIYEQKRQESHNIFVVDTSIIPRDLLDKAKIPASLTYATGRSLFAFLRYISDAALLDSIIPLSEILEEKYKAFSSYNKIAQYDLIRIQNIGRVYFASTEMAFADEDAYNMVVKAIQSGNKTILNAFRKAGLSAIHCESNDSRFSLPDKGSEPDPYFELYLQNDYCSLQKELAKGNNYPQRLYYSHLFGASMPERLELIEKMYKSSSSDYISILLCKMRERLAKLTIFDRQAELTKEIEQLLDTPPAKYRNAIGFLRLLFETTAKLECQMQEILEKQEKRNEYGRLGWESGHAFTHIWKIQAMAYDYYFFFKENYLPFDYYSDPSRYLRYYVQAILSSYTPVAKQDSDDDWFPISTDHKHYPLNEIDLDIFVKYTDPKSFKSWLKKYAVQSIDLSESGNIAAKYSNLCSSFFENPHKKWPEQVFCFTIVVCLAELDSKEKVGILSNLIDIYDRASEKAPHLCEPLFEPLFHVVSSFQKSLPEHLQKQILASLLKPDVYQIIQSRYNSSMQRIFQLYHSALVESMQEEQINYIDSLPELNVKARELFARRWLLPKDRCNELIHSCSSCFSADDLFHLLIEKHIVFTPEIQERFISTVNNEHKKRIEHPNMRSAPDWLITTIEECLILRLLGFNFILSQLEPYSRYSVHLQFMLNPEEFDYTKVNTDHYMWQNLIYSKEYGDFFRTHKAVILSPELKNIFRMGLASKDQEKIVYGILLNDEELRGFPEQA